jgi:hypothetical protein
VSWEFYQRLEPARPGEDLERGFRAEIADPAWLLGRQWQLGEHQGEDASTPVVVRMEAAYEPIESAKDDPRGRAPTRVPAEAIVESEPDDWWTLGRRIRLGRAVAPSLGDPPDEDHLFGALPPPYERFAGAVDGLAVHRDADFRDHPAFAGVPVAAPDRWRDDRLSHGAEFPVAGGLLRLRDHDGGDVDWFSADAEGVDPKAFRKVHIQPSRLRYPGAPLPRWWQIEDGHVDIGGFPPDRSHPATLLLIDLVVSHSDDWFTFPLKPDPEKPSSGVVVTMRATEVLDDFGQWWPLAVPAGEREPVDPAARLAAEPWSLFRTQGLDRRALVVWPTAATPLSGPLLDDVVLGVDEDANLLWAVELRAEGAVLAPDAEATAAVGETTPTGSREFEYLPSTTLPPHWHPYRVERDVNPRRFRQGLVADLKTTPPKPREGPRSPLLRGGPETGHELLPAAVPSHGLRLERRFVLARATDGTPALWVQRRRVPLLAGPVSHLRFDVLAERSAP